MYNIRTLNLKTHKQMEVIYARISHKTQNDDTQKKDGVQDFTDTTPGTVSFMERPKAKKLLAYLKKNPTAKTIVKDISRLGRNTKDVLNTIEFFNEHNYELEITNPGIKTNTEVGKMMITMISAIYEMELNNIKTRTQQGREIAKIKGVYKGRKPGAKASNEVLIKKHSDIVNCLKQGMSMNKTATTLKKNRATVKRIDTILKSSIEYRQHSILDDEYKKVKL